MSTRRVLRLALVPEQVNIPVAWAVQELQKSATSLGVQLLYTPEGTGKMMDMLERREADVALTVADGFIAGRAGSGKKPVRLMGTFVESPLIWAVACGASSPYKTLDDLAPAALGRACRFGISRLGSGSHTMGIYTGKNFLRGAATEFVVANNINGLRDGANSNLFDAFMWETFTTKPLFDSGALKKVGEVATPWPAFVFVCSSSAESAAREREINSDLKEHLFPALKAACERFVDPSPAAREAAVQRICSEHGHQRQDALQWLSAVQYASGCSFGVSRSRYARAVETLQEAGLVPHGYKEEDLWNCESDAEAANVFA